MDLTKEKLQKNAKEAVISMLRKEASLDEGIAKVAEAEDMNRFQIQRLVEASNNFANASLRKLAKDKRFTFDMASLGGVLSHLDEVPEELPVKTASLSSAMQTQAKHASFSTRRNPNPIEQEQMVKQALHHLGMIQTHLNIFSRELQGKVDSVDVRRMDNLEKYAAYIKESILSNTPDIDEVIQLMQIEENESMRNVLVKGAALIAEEFREKVAAWEPERVQRLNKYANLTKTAEDWPVVNTTPEDDPAYKDLKKPTYTDKQHGLVILVDDMKSTEYDRRRLMGGADDYRAANFGVARAIKDISDSKKVDRFVMDEIFGLSRSAEKGIEPTTKKVAFMVKEGNALLSKLLREAVGKAGKGFSGLLGPILAGTEALRFGADVGGRTIQNAMRVPANALGRVTPGEPSMGIVPHGTPVRQSI